VPFSPNMPPVFPENSMAAFRWAASQECGGADGIELDVWLSKDGVPMVNHDPDVFRHFDGRGLISDMSCAELQKLKFLRNPILPANAPGGAHLEVDQQFIDTERMPTLDEVLDFLEREAPHMKLMIEVKERHRVTFMAQILATLYSRRPWMYDRAWVAAFNPIMIYRVRQLDARIVTSFLFNTHLTMHLMKNAADMSIELPWWFTHVRPVRWAIDDLTWFLGTHPAGLRFLGANLSACEASHLSLAQIRRDRSSGVVTSCWVANHELQKEWLLSCGVTVITDMQFGGGTATKKPRTQYA